jgi:acyl-CoA thioesterase
MTAFQQETAVRPTGAPGRYRGELHDEWCTFAVPQGGVVAAVAARAALTDLDAPDLSLRSITTVFAAPVPSGPIDVDVSILRRGRSMAQAVVTVREPDAAAGATSVIVLGAPRIGFEFTDLTMPEIPPPDECPSFRDGPPPELSDERRRFAFWEHHVEGRAGMGHPPWEEFHSTSSEGAFWYRFEQTPRLADGRLDPLALLPLSDTMPGSVNERMGGGLPVWFAPSADLTVHLLGEHRADWVLARNRARHAGDGYASLQVELWDAEQGTLSAIATQMMVFTFPEGPPPPELRIPRDQRDARDAARTPS